MTKLQNSIFQILSLTWCLMFWVVPAAIFWTMMLPLSSTTDILSSGLICALVTLFVGYIPMVFFGVGLVVIIESVIRKGMNSVIYISSESWHAQTTGAKGKTLCSYCWMVPAQTLGCVIESISNLVFAVFCYLITFMYIWFMSWFRDRNYKITVKDVVSMDNVGLSDLFHPRMVVASVENAKPFKEPSRFRLVFVRCRKFVMDVLCTVYNIIVTLKRKACPMIQKI